MDRQIVYAGAIPLETDLLNTNKYAMIGLAKLASALLGSNTYVHGLACTPSSPASMIVNVAAGQIYSLQNIDGTAYSSLAADTTHTILKQGLILDATQFTLTAPGTSGYSVNYLIQVTYTDMDSGATVLPYYNASNPSVAWSGPNNSGTAQNTVRSGICTVALKAGVAATTGTQTTPSPDTGYTGLHVITVAQGATTVTAANISVYPNAPILNQAGIYDSFQRNTAIYGIDTGAANAYVVNINPKILSLTDGAEVIFKATNANTTSSTLNVCALGAFPVTSKAGATLIANEIVANSLVKVRWSASASSWVLMDATGTFQTAPTATAGTSTTQVATTAFVANAILAAPGRLLGAPRMITATGTSTYTPTPGTTFCIVELVGASGGSGGVAATNASTTVVTAPSCQGTYACFYYPNPTTQSVSIGAGGIRGAAGGGNGSPGGSSSFGTLVVCPGGQGSYAAAPSTGAISPALGAAAGAPTVNAGVTLISSIYGKLPQNAIQVSAGIGTNYSAAPNGPMWGTTYGMSVDGVYIPVNTSATPGNVGYGGACRIWEYA